MPEFCRSYGIIIRMFYDEHEQPHSHAAYQGKVAQIGIDPLTIMRGRLQASSSHRAYGVVFLHRLSEAFKAAIHFPQAGINERDTASRVISRRRHPLQHLARNGSVAGAGVGVRWLE